jgi:hypothetical protein
VADSGAAAGSDWPSAAVEASQQPGRDTNSILNDVVIWMHDAHDYRSGVLAAKKHNLAWENSECTRNSEKQKSKKLKRVAQLGVKYFNNHEGESSSSIFPNSRATKHCGNIRASKSNIKRIT